MEARAIVVNVAHGQAQVRISDRQDGCGRCDEPGGCRSVRIAHAFKVPEDVFSVEDTLGLKKGDRVLVSMDDGAPLRGAMVSYGLAATLLVAGAGLGHRWAGAGLEDLYALAGGVVGLMLAVTINRLLHSSRVWRDGMRISLLRDEGGCAHAGPTEGGA